MSEEEVSIIYSENGNSRGATVIGILDQFLLQGDVEPLTDSEKMAVDGLKQKYRNISEEYLQVIVRRAGSTAAYATELASLANTYFSKRSMNQKLELGYRLTPLPHEDIEGLTDATVDSLSQVKKVSRWVTSREASDHGMDLTQALQTSNTLQRQKRGAMESAASLYRRGASNPLYRQAAGYYAQQAHEYSRHAQEATSAAADIHVDQQSTDGTVDLHGVSVRDGVRIACQRALDWWQKPHEPREGQSPDRSLTIITGVGHHNAGGVSPLRRAVASALKQDGWKFRIETGKFIITGRR